MKVEDAKRWLPVIGWLAEGKLEWLDAFGNWIKVNDIMDFTTFPPERYRRKEFRPLAMWSFVPKGEPETAYGGYQTEEMARRSFGHIEGRFVKMVEVES